MGDGEHETRDGSRHGATIHVAALLYQDFGIRFAAEKRYADAERAFAQALAADSSALDALYNLAVVRQMAGRHEAAIEDYRRLLESSPPTPGLLINLSNSYAALRRVDEAIAALEQALSLRPDLPEVRAMLARLYEARGRR